jgi:hypothetical protein
MKKQNVNNRLAFKKIAVIELNDGTLGDVNGGSTPLCVVAFIESFALSVGIYVGIKQLVND